MLCDNMKFGINNTLGAGCQSCDPGLQNCRFCKYYDKKRCDICLNLDNAPVYENGYYNCRYCSKGPNEIEYYSNRESCMLSS